MFESIKTKNFSYYLIGNILFQLTFIGSELVILNLLGAELVGLWQWMLLLFTYSQLTRLGIINSFNREYPQSIFLKKLKRAERVLKVTRSHIFLSGFIQSAFFIGLAFYLLQDNSITNNSLAALAMAIYVVLESLINFSEAVLRGKGKFALIGKIKLIGTIILVFSLLLPKVFGFEGMLLRVILIQIFILSMHMFVNLDMKVIPLFFRKHVWLSLFNDGRRVWLWSYLKSFSVSIPKLFVLNVLGIVSLGMFTPINWVLLAVSLITNSLSSYLQPILARKTLENKSNTVWSVYIFYLKFVAILIPCTFVGVLFIPSLVEALLPRYLNIIIPMQLSMLSGVIDIMLLVASSWVVAKDYFRMYAFLFGVLLIKICCFLILYLYFPKDLLNVTIFMVFSSLLCAIWVSLLVFLQKENRLNINV